MKLSLRAFLIISFLTCNIIAIFFLVIDYAKILEYITLITNSENYKSEIKELIPPITLKAITIYVFCIAIISIFILYKFEFLYKNVLIFIERTTLSIRIRIRDAHRNNIFIVLCIPVLTTLYYAIKSPISNDEAYTYVNYVSRSIFTSVFYLKDPNNHILHSILACILDALPIPNLVAIRLPVLLISIINLLIVYSLLKEYFNRSIALTATAIYSTFFMVLYYSFQSRGYYLQILAFLIVTYSIFKILEYNKNKLYWIYYCIGSFIGLYSIQSYLYAFIITNTFLIIQLKRISKEHFISNILILTLLLVVYLPAIIINGMEAIFFNKFITPIDRNTVIMQMPDIIKYSLNEITGLHYYLVIILLLVATFVSLKKHNKKHTQYFIFAILLTPILLVAHSVIPFPRTLIFWGISIALLFAILFVSFLEKIKFERNLSSILILIQLVMIINFNYLVIEKESISFDAKNQMLKIKSGDNFFISTKLFDNYLTYYFKTWKKNNYHIQYHLETPVSIDTISNINQYDYLIIDNYLDQTKHTKPISRSENYTIYQPVEN